MKKEKISDAYFKILILQSVTVAVILISVLILKLIGGAAYENIREKYVEYYNEVTDVNDVLKSTENTEESAVGKYIGGAYGENVICSPLSGIITSSFGYRTNPIDNEYKMHGGIDIGVSEGTEILSALDGTVSEIGESNSYGKYVIIDHGNGTETVYAHCSKITSDKGDAVNKGETVALSGNTGASTGPHLHFEMRINGESVNPLWFINTYEI